MAYAMVFALAFLVLFLALAMVLAPYFYAKLRLHLQPKHMRILSVLTGVVFSVPVTVWSIYILPWFMHMVLHSFRYAAGFVV